MFESYFSAQRSFWQTARQPIVWSSVFHFAAIATIVIAPFIVIKTLEPPLLPTELFEAAPPPPPPPPPAGNKAKTEHKEEVKPKSDALVEPTQKPEEMPHPQESEDQGVEGGVEGGEVGGVVGGVLGGSLDDNAKVLVRPQRKLSGDPPVFPATARTQGLSATIAARVCVSALGRVTSVKILRGAPMFSDAVQTTVMTWTYEPYRAGSTAIPACFPVYFNFNLKE